MKIFCRLLLLLGVVCVAATSERTHAQTSAATLEELRRGFVSPPDDARPMVRWWWFGPAVTDTEIKRELEQMKADGIGGAELAFVYPEELDDPARGIKNEAFLSPEMLAHVRYAETAGRALGLRVDVTLCSGWPYGGSNTPLSEAAGKLKLIEVAVPADADHAPMPFGQQQEGDVGIAQFIVPGAAQHWKADQAAPLPLLVFQNSNDFHLAPADVPRVALFFYASHTLQQVKRAAVGAEGYVLDPFSKQAVATHLAKVGEPLVKAFGDTPPYAIFSDSLEAYGADWTPNLPAEFQKRRGYDLLLHLPELVAGGTPAAEKVRHDWGQTLTALVNENYLTQINDWATAHGTRFRSQTYGEPAVSFSSQRLAALPEGEGPQWRAFSTLRWASSANHVFGNNVTSGETFTWLHSPVFRATPLDMKAEADIDFIMGENQLMFHGWPYSPPQSGIFPGWSLYAAGSFNDNNPWHPVMPAVTKYITRLSWLLRQGEPANQVAVLLPTDDAWAGFSPGKVTVTGAMQKLVPRELIAAILSAGYNLDFIDAEAINTVGLGTHQVLVLPPTDRVPAKTLAKVEDWQAHGGKLICVGKLPSIDADGAPLRLGMQSAVLVSSAADIADALHRAAKPDLNLLPAAETLPAQLNSIGFIRRRLADADIYFVANTSNQPVRTLAEFQTSFQRGTVIDTDSGSEEAFGRDGDRMSFDLALQPYESRIFIFSRTASAEKFARAFAPLQDISTGWKLTFTGTGKSVNEDSLADWTRDPVTLHYSGEAVYTREVTLKSLPAQAIFLTMDGGRALPGSPDSPPEHEALGKDGLPNPLVTRTGPGMHAYFDPPIREAALVFVNGQQAGALWHPPYRLDVTKLLKPGTNHIEIRVYNTALNAWSALPPHDFGPLKAKYGDRFQMQDLDKIAPLPSGILGTIQLVTEGPQ